MDARPMAETGFRDVKATSTPSNEAKAETKPVNTQVIPPAVSSQPVVPRRQKSASRQARPREWTTCVEVFSLEFTFFSAFKKSFI